MNQPDLLGTHWGNTTQAKHLRTLSFIYIPHLTRELRIRVLKGALTKSALGLDNMQTGHGVLGGASWTRGKVCEAQMRLVTSQCRRIRAPSSARWHSYSYRHRSRTPRGKMATTTSFCRHRSRTSLDTSSPCKVDGTRAKDPVCSSWFLTRSSMPI